MSTSAVETSLQRAMFLYYLELPLGERTLEKVATHFEHSVSRISQISSTHSWMGRAAAYDAAVADQALAMAMEEQAREKLRHLRERALVNRMLRGKAFRYIKDREIEGGIDPETNKKILGMDVQKAKLCLDMLTAVDRWERLDDNLATERTEVQGTIAQAPLEIRIIRGDTPPTVQVTEETVEGVVATLPPRVATVPAPPLLSPTAQSQGDEDAQVARKLTEVLGSLARGGPTTDEDETTFDLFPTADDPDPT